MSPTNCHRGSDDAHPCPDVPMLPEESDGVIHRNVPKEDMNGINNNNTSVKSEQNGDSNGHATSAGFDLAKYEAMEFRPQVRWPDLMAQLFLHLVSFYGIYLILTFQVKILTILFAILVTYTSGFGITAGAHRLWSHRAYRANIPMRILLAFLFSITGQPFYSHHCWVQASLIHMKGYWSYTSTRDLYTWALDHRVHHKYSETVADPHDARRGFWFAHVGWLFLTPHPAVEDRRRELRAISQDLLNDPVVYWQKIFNVPLFALLNIGLPVWIPMHLWGESLLNSFVISFVTRFTVTLNIAYCVNSVAHFWGNKPYDRFIMSVENKMVSMMAMGEGWHNYHHTFPWDYKTSELGRVNPSTRFIDFFASLGWVSDRKSASAQMVEMRSKRCGDGTRQLPEHTHEGAGLWGYGDPDMPTYEKKLLTELSCSDAT